MRSLLYRLYWWFETRLVPELRSSQREFAEVLERQLENRPIWLEIGCGRRPFPVWMSESEKHVLAKVELAFGIDLDFESLREHTAYPDKAMASAYQVPFASGCIDLLSANMVVEHIEEPLRLLAEVRRLLKPGGKFLFHTTNRNNILIQVASRTPELLKKALVRWLENRDASDVFPTFYRFNRKSDIENAARQAGMRVASLVFVSTSALTAMLGPFCILELLWLRWISRPGFELWRTNIIGVLEPESEPVTVE